MQIIKYMTPQDRVAHNILSRALRRIQCGGEGALLVKSNLFGMAGRGLIPAPPKDMIYVPADNFPAWEKWLEDQITQLVVNI